MDDCIHIWQHHPKMTSDPQEACSKCGVKRTMPRHRFSGRIVDRPGVMQGQVRVCRKCRRPADHPVHQPE